MSRRTKGPLVIALVLMALTLAACEEDDQPSGPAKGRSNYVTEEGERVYFSFRDPMYDDRGTGSYTYPLLVENPTKSSSVVTADGSREDPGQQATNLETKTGLFDVTDFKVVSDGENVVFEVTMQRPIPRFRDDQTSGPQGWYLQLMDIYIDKDHKAGSGRTRTLPGRNLSFPPENAWEQMILVTPQVPFDVRRTIEQITWDLDFVRMKPDIYIPDRVFIEGYMFRVFVPKTTIGEPQPGWGYQCLVMLFNQTNFEYGHFQQGKVKRFSGNNVFGGADEFNGHPNVIDMLAPTPEDQYRLMSDFVSGPNPADDRYAIVPMMYADDARPRAVAARNGRRPNELDSRDRSVPVAGRGQGFDAAGGSYARGEEPARRGEPVATSAVRSVAPVRTSRQAAAQTSPRAQARRAAPQGGEWVRGEVVGAVPAEDAEAGGDEPANDLFTNGARTPARPATRLTRTRATRPGYRVARFDADEEE